MSRKCRSFLLFLFGFDSFSSSRSCAVVVAAWLSSACLYGIGHGRVDGLLLFLDVFFFFFFFRGVYIIAGPRESGIMLTA